jgi:hypothetical protein
MFELMNCPPVSETWLPAVDLAGGEFMLSQLPSVAAGSILTEDGGDGGR